MYQTDQEIHQYFVKLTTGGGEGPGDCGAEDLDPADTCATLSKDASFPLLPWSLNLKDIDATIDMTNRTRQARFTKKLMVLPYMRLGAPIAAIGEEVCRQRERELERRSCYASRL